MSSSPHFGTGQTHLNSDAKIADEGRPQGAPLPIAFSRRYALGRAPTRGAPTNCLLSAFCPGEGTHKGRPYQLPSLMPWGLALGRAPTRGAPTSCLLSAFGPGDTNCLSLCPGEGTHKGRPYQLSSLGVLPWGGHPQGAPLPIAFSRRFALGRAPTRGAPTNCLLQALCPGEGTHKGRPYQLPSLGVLPWGGHPQGAPLPIVPIFSALCPGEGTHKGRPYIAFSRRLGHPQGAPYQLSSLGVMPWGGHPQGVPLPIAFSRRFDLGRVPTRGAPTDCLFSALWPGEGTHKGRPYRLSFLGVMAWGGRPQGAPLPIAFARRYALGRAPTRGAPTDCLLSAFCPAKGTHKGCPYRFGVMALGRAPTRGAPTNCPLPIAFSRRYGLRRAPTRGAPTRFRQPHVGLSQFDAIALHFGMHPAAMGRAGAQFGSPRSCCKGNRRRL